MKLFLSKSLIAIITVLYSFSTYGQSNNPKVKIANWQGNKKAAVSVTLDDGCEQQFTVAKPIMDNLGIKGTFYIITDLDKNCDGGPNANPPMAIYNGNGSPTYWATLQDAINNGHEIGAHTVHHPNLDSVFNKGKGKGPDSLGKEIRLSKIALENELHQPNTTSTPYNVLTFAYPYGSGQDTLPIIDTVQKYFIAARGAGTSPGKQWDTYDDANPNNTGFISYYYQVESFAATDTLTTSELNFILNNTIKNNGWFNAMYHNIGGNGLEGDLYSVSEANFSAQMNAITAKQDSMWIAPFKDVVRYSKENISSKATVKSCTSSSTVIGLTDTINNLAFNVPLTLIVSNFNCVCTIDSVMQAGSKLLFTVNNNTQIQFDGIPNAGDITIYTGTGNATAIVVPSSDDYFELYQSVPNPASSTATISYNLKQNGSILLELFDINGTTTKTLVNEEQQIGKHSYAINTESLQAGIYFYRLNSGNFFDVKKMVVIK